MGFCLSVTSLRLQRADPLGLRSAQAWINTLLPLISEGKILSLDVLSDMDNLYYKWRLHLQMAQNALEGNPAVAKRQRLLDRRM